ncbi:unnamed protein product [Staurois parvus]|uniref:Uncharacterized protein n=1 Tax=Staurois parvus TaxID=386267 RepID=A0ABN9DWY5_9NEOB|nr:unnamed protein product [Staurois parvus]
MPSPRGSRITDSVERQHERHFFLAEVWMPDLPLDCKGRVTAKGILRCQPDPARRDRPRNGGSARVPGWQIFRRRAISRRIKAELQGVGV